MDSEYESFMALKQGKKQFSATYLERPKLQPA